jgi:hypothetical protein
MWNFFRLENEHLNNCGQFRAIKDIPLPFHIRVEGDSDEEEEEEEEEVGTGADQHKDTALVGDTSPSAAAAAVTDASTATSPSRRRSRQQSLSHLTSASGSISRSSVQSPGSIAGGHRKRPSRSSSSLRRRPASSTFASLAEGGPDSMMIPRSKTFVDEAMAEAGFGDNQRELLVGATLAKNNKFYDRRDFDSRIVDVPETLTKVKSRSSAVLSSGRSAVMTTTPTPMSPAGLTGLGMEYPTITTHTGGSTGLISPLAMPAASVRRRKESMGTRIKSGFFGRLKDDSDDDDDEDDE